MDKQEKKAAEALRKKRWNGSISCLYCSSAEVVKNGMRKDGIQQYRCKKCSKSFNDRTKTVFSETQMKLHECFEIIQMVQDKSSITEISQKTGRSWKTVKDFLVALDQVIGPQEIASDYKDREQGKLDYSRFGCGNSSIIP